MVWWLCYCALLKSLQSVLSREQPDVHHPRTRVRAQPEHAWTVVELADERGISARELQRRCRVATGHGPKQLILQERHRAAEALLIEGSPVLPK